MAAITPVITRIGKNTIKVFWETLTSSSTSGVAVNEALIGDYADRSVQITGTFGAGTLKMQGANDLTNYVSLTDPQGNAIEKTAATLEQIMEVTLGVKPVVTGGDGTTDIDITLIARRNG